MLHVAACVEGKNTNIAQTPKKNAAPIDTKRDTHAVRTFGVYRVFPVSPREHPYLRADTFCTNTEGFTLSKNATDLQRTESPR